MEKAKTFFKKHPLLLGLMISFIALIIGVVYSSLFNDNRIVEPTDYSDYVFQIKDLSMIIPLVMLISLMLVSIIYYSALIIKASLNGKNLLSNSNTHTPKYPKYLYLLGCFGIIGFIPFLPPISSLTFESSMGILTFDNGIMSVALFGFFSLYYENKMANTMIDELYLSNKAKAEAIAFKTSLTIIFIISWIVIPRLTTRLLNQVLILTISLAFAFSHIYKSYLIYKYETED